MRHIEAYLYYLAQNGGGGSSTSPGGSDTQIQFNDGGAFGGSAGLTWNKSTSLLTAARLSLTGVSNQVILGVSGYSLTGSNASSMINLVGTWNTTGTPTAISVNITDTASNANSHLLDMKVDGNQVFSVSKDGIATLGGTRRRLQSEVGTSLNVFGSGGNGIFFGTNTDTFGGIMFLSDAALQLNANLPLAWTEDGLSFSTKDVYLRREGPGHLSLRNAENPQRLTLFGTFTDASNFDRVGLGFTADAAELLCENLGSGVSRDLQLTPSPGAYVRFGNYISDPAVVLDGYIAMRDIGGTVRKLAIVA